MTDFLKSNPSVTREEYMWQWTVPQVKLSMYDYTHVEYHSDEDKKKRKKNVKSKTINSAKDLMNDLGFPIFKAKKE